VLRCGAGSFMKIIVQESLKSQRVQCMRVGTSSQRRVRESSLCLSACFCEDPLQLKRVTIEELPGSKD
jgi:hypothetical protein